MSPDSLRLLVVDDEPGILRIFSVAMSNYGYIVECAGSSREARALLEARSYDIVVSDVQMPGGDGIDLLADARRNGLAMPFILMSGRPDSRLRARALAGGAYSFMIKPVMPSELRATVENALAIDRRAPSRSPSAVPYGSSPTGRR